MTDRDLRVGFRVSDDYIARFPQADPSATELVINVFYTAELLFSRMDRLLQRFELSRGAFNLLQVVGGATGPITPTEIADRLIVSTATVTGLLDTMERRSLITRSRDTADRRRVLVEITADGSSLIERIGGELVDREKAWSSGLTAADREALVRRLGKLQTHLRGLAVEP